MVVIVVGTVQYILHDAEVMVARREREAGGVLSWLLCGTCVSLWCVGVVGSCRSVSSFTVMPDLLTLPCLCLASASAGLVLPPSLGLACLGLPSVGIPSGGIPSGGIPSVGIPSVGRSVGLSVGR